VGKGGAYKAKDRATQSRGNGMIELVEGKLLSDKVTAEQVKKLGFIVEKLKVPLEDFTHIIRSGFEMPDFSDLDIKMNKAMLEAIELEKELNFDIDDIRLDFDINFI